MTLIASALMALALQAAPASGWTWSLYEGEGPLVLANDIPDTAALRSTLQCQAGSGAVTIAIYGEPATAGFARITAGGNTAASEARPVQKRSHPAGIVAGKVTRSPSTR